MYLWSVLSEFDNRCRIRRHQQCVSGILIPVHAHDIFAIRTEIHIIISDFDLIAAECKTTPFIGDGSRKYGFLVTC